MKVLKCKDAGFDCNWEARADSVDEIMQQAGEHAVNTHQLDVTPELVAQIKDLITDE